MSTKHPERADKSDVNPFIDKLPTVINSIKTELDEKEGVYKQIYNVVRDALADIKRGIQHVHRRELGQAEEKLKKAAELVKDLWVYKDRFPDLFYKHVEPVYQELAEALILLNLFKKGELPDPDEYGIPRYQYLLGLCDFVGELRRSILLCIKDEKYKEAEELLNVMDFVYEAVSTLIYPNAVAPGLRQKVDFVRRILEITRADVILILCKERMLRRVTQGVKGE